MQFLDDSPCSYLAASSAEELLIQAGFSRLMETEVWKLKAGQGYYLTRNDSSLIAFRLGKKNPDQTGFGICAAHLDSPALKLKSEAERLDKNYAKIGVEVYGGPITSTWLDRELSIAGRVMVMNSKTKKTEARLVDLKAPIAIIPNAAIHMNREVNKGFEYNAQTHLSAILQATGEEKAQNALKQLLADHLKLKPEQILESDLFLYDTAKAAKTGLNGELLTCGRLDDLAMAHAILLALMESKAADQTQLAVLYDNEEIGSQTLQGANSSLLNDILQRICLSQKLDAEGMQIALRKSFIISGDMAHAYHPNFAEKHDPAYAPLMNHGPVIKMNANFRYATTAESCAAFSAICKRSKVPVQKIINRSDLPCGSTVGPMTSAALSIPAVDIGNPMWAMHSIRETMGVYDHEYLIMALTEFYQNGI
jgi:aspartyl aminopeptidase